MRTCLIVLLAAAILAGCKTSGGGCGKPPEYTNSDSIPPLAVPPGMDAPNTRGALRVPELETPERPRRLLETLASLLLRRCELLLAL